MDDTLQHGPQKSTDFQDIHNDILPVNILRGQRVRATFTPDPPTGEVFDLRVWRISPFGLEAIDNDACLKESTNYQIDLRLKDENIKLFGAVTGSEQAPTQDLVAGLRFHKRLDASTEYIERKVERWQCDKLYPPIGQTTRSAKFNDIIYFRVIDLSPVGLLFYTSLRNKHLLPGTVLNCKITFPLGRVENGRLAVKHVTQIDQDGAPAFAVGCTWDFKSGAMQQAAGDYLLQFGNIDGNTLSTRQLRQAGFSVRARSSVIEFCYVQTEAEYKDVLSLRCMAFGSPSGLMATPDKWGDKYDARSRILAGKFRSQVLASTRLIYSEPGDALEQEDFCKLPIGLPPSDEILECGRTCTHPDYRGDDLLMSLFRFVVLTTLEAQRKYILINCTNNLIPLYKRLGFVNTGAFFIHPNDESRHNLLLMDLQKALTGQSISPLTWAVFYGKFWAEIEQYVSPIRSPLWRLNLKLLKLCLPLINVFVRNAGCLRRNSKKKRVVANGA
jgi:predicted GNAT family N-acyltransferase